jgi:hypothetical protein
MVLRGLGTLEAQRLFPALYFCCVIAHLVYILNVFVCLYTQLLSILPPVHHLGYIDAGGFSALHAHEQIKLFHK